MNCDNYTAIRINMQVENRIFLHIDEYFILNLLLVVCCWLLGLSSESCNDKIAQIQNAIGLAMLLS